MRFVFVFFLSFSFFKVSKCFAAFCREQGQNIRGEKEQYSDVKPHYVQIIPESWPSGGIKRYFIVYFKCVFGFKRLSVY